MVTRAVRLWFEDAGFTEVETAILQVSPGNETHLHAPCAELTSALGEKTKRLLRTSPEFACKKLLAAGEEKIVEFARVFRDRERGPLHLPEFTMLEWYRARRNYDAVMADCIAVIREAAQATGADAFAFRGRTVDPFAEPERLTVAGVPFDREQFEPLPIPSRCYDEKHARISAELYGPTGKKPSLRDEMRRDGQWARERLKK